MIDTIEKGDQVADVDGHVWEVVGVSEEHDRIVVRRYVPTLEEYPLSLTKNRTGMYTKVTS
jgi:hypothetical protein